MRKRSSFGSVLALMALMACTQQWFGEVSGDALPGGTVDLEVDVRYIWSVRGPLEIALCTALPTGWEAPTLSATRGSERTPISSAPNETFTAEAEESFPLSGQTWHCMATAPQEGHPDGGAERGHVIVTLAIPAGASGRYSVTTLGGTFGNVGLGEEWNWGDPTEHLLLVDVESMETFESWSQGSLGPDPEGLLPPSHFLSIRAIGYGDGRFLASDGDFLYSSATGENWLSREEELVDFIYDDDSSWIALRPSSIVGMSFVDGAPVFEERVTLTGSADYFMGIAKSSAGFAAITSRGMVYRSSDGTDWTEIVEEPLLEIVGGATGFLTFSETGVRRSSDGSTWTKVDLGTTRLDTAAYGNGRWIGISRDDHDHPLHVSLDGGESWAPLRSAQAREGFAPKTVSFMDGRFVLGSESSSIWVGSGTSGWVETPTGNSDGLSVFAESDDVVVGGSRWRLLARAIKRAPAVPEIRTSMVPGAESGELYLAPLDVAYGKGAIALRVVGGALPPGVELDEDVLVGVPLSAGSFEFTVEARDEAGQASTRALAIEVEQGGPKLPDLEALYVRAVGSTLVELPILFGVGPFEAEISGGTLAPEVSIDGRKVLAVFTVSGWTEGTVEIFVKDSEGRVEQRTYDVLAVDAPSIEAGPRALAKLGEDYEWSFTATGDAGGYRWSVDGALPEGVEPSMDDERFVLSGTVAGSVGSFPFTVIVEDAAGWTVELEAEIEVIEAARISSSELPVAAVNEPYQAVLQASKGLAPYTWETSGELPAGFEWSTDEAAGTLTLHGETEEEGEFPLTVTLRDASGTVAPTPISLIVGVRPVPRAVELGAAQVGVAFEASFMASGGKRPYEFSLSGELPRGVTFTTEGKVGILAGIPEEAGEFAFRVRVTDADGLMASFRPMTLEVAPAAETPGEPGGEDPGGEDPGEKNPDGEDPAEKPGKKKPTKKSSGGGCGAAGGASLLPLAWVVVLARLRRRR